MKERKEISPEDKEYLIRELCRVQFDNGWNQRQLGDAMKMCKTSINKIMNGSYNISEVTRRRIEWFIGKYPRT